MTYVINVTPAMWSAWCDLSWHRMWSHHGSWLPFTGPVPEIECPHCESSDPGWVSRSWAQVRCVCRGTGKRPIDRLALCVPSLVESVYETADIASHRIVGSATVAEIVPISLDPDRNDAYVMPDPIANELTYWPGGWWDVGEGRPGHDGSANLSHLLDLANWSDKAECQEFHGDDTYACGLPLPRFAARLTGVATTDQQCPVCGSEDYGECSACDSAWLPPYCDPIPVTAPDTDQLWEMP